jgi:FdhE protein
MNRILEPSEIEALDHSAIRRVRLPQRTEVFMARAKRLRALATEGHLIRDYLLLMADLADAQHEAIAQLRWPQVTPLAPCADASLQSAPAGAAHSSSRDPAWRDVLEFLLSRLEVAHSTHDQLVATCARLRALDAASLEREADLLLTAGGEAFDNLSAPLIAAALQVIWTDAASRLTPDQVPYPDAAGQCPVCGTHALASVVRAGGAEDGYRYLACGVCATETHVVRVKCTHCESTRGIAYQMIEGQSDWAKAESCDECRTYRKIFYQSRQLEVEPFADDLATLALDLLMNDADYLRPVPHPWLWPAGSNEAFVS